MKHLCISRHALDRYRERFRIRQGADRTLVDRLRHYWRLGEPVTRCDSAIAMEEIEHGSVSEWRHFRGVIMIVVAGSMVTVIRRDKQHKPLFHKRLRGKQ